MHKLTLSQIYFWKKQSSCTYPWQRQFLNFDFLKFEKKRIQDVTKWYISFQKEKLGQTVEEVYYYVTPIELDSEWKSAVALRGNYNFVGLSALKSCLQVNLLMLIPKDKNMPKDYSLIRILNSKKDYIHNEKKNEVQYVIVCDTFYEENPINAYLDVPYEKKIISKFIKENLVNDDLIANSFQPTISGSPYIVNKKGGISFSAFLKNTSFSEELLYTLKLMQPIEFSDLQFQISPKLMEGKNILTSDGVKYRVAERSILGNNYFSAFSSNNYNRLNEELVRRDTFKGEYSILCSLNPRGDKASELLRDIISKFVKTEIMHPYNTDELKYWDVDLSKTQRNIDEDLWLQVVNQKQLSPVIPDNYSELVKLRENLNKEWQIILEAMRFKKNIEHESKVYSVASFSNILRVAQSIARDEQRNSINDTILAKSYNLFVRSAEGLIGNEEIQHQVKVIIPEKYESAKFNAVRAELSVNLLDINELFNNIKEYFKDVYELQEYIDKLIMEGYIFEPKRGYCKWV